MINFIKLKNKKNGFTLIELLVVISIIGILSSLVIFSINGARESARDARRITDLEQIAIALEMYRLNCNGYPASVTFGGSMAGSGTGSCTGTYMAAVPADPRAPRTYSYTRTGTGNTYIMCASLEQAPATPNNTGCGSCGSGFTCNYRITSP